LFILSKKGFFFFFFEIPKQELSSATFFAPDLPDFSDFFISG